MSDYKPKPLPSSPNLLPEELALLMEKLSENAHEVWSASRISQGWVWGPERNDDAKTHPCLIPYDDLDESEKVHDRNAVAGALLAILHHGWKLIPPAERIGALGLTVNAADPAELRTAWEKRADDEFNAHPLDDYRSIAKLALGFGELLLVCDAAQAGLCHYPGDPLLTRLAARALAEMGRPDIARARVEALVAAGHEDCETLGLLGRTFKDEGFAHLAAGLSPDEAWEQSARAYGKAFAAHEDYFTGINTATMAFLHGGEIEVEKLVWKVDALAAEALRVSGDHWALATRGEVSLLTRRWGDAEKFYRQAAEGLAERSVDLASMGRQARRLLAAWKRRGERVDEETRWIDSVFPQADVLVFSGQASEGLAEEELRAALISWLERVGTQVVYTTVSTTADLLLAEAALELGVSLRLVLSKPVVELEERFQRVCSLADSATVLGDGTISETGLVAEHCCRVFTGLAQLEADGLGVNVRGLAVCDGSAGGTAEYISGWRHAGIKADVIDPATSELKKIGGRESKDFAKYEDLREGLVIRAMLFADVKGFSKLDERELNLFIREFRSDLAKLVSGNPEGCEMVNTWGDGVLMVFRDAVSAARMALEFRDIIAGKDWEASGLGTQLGIRIGLHAGPVWAVAHDPILGKPDFSGGNINRAARIEPITEVNQIYASDSFAALVRLEGDTGLRLNYVGSLPLVKRYGRQRLFRLDWVLAGRGDAS